jgi:energy-converting hydrogenase B subunit Q
MSDRRQDSERGYLIQNSLSLSVETLRHKGVLHELSGVILRHGGDVSSVAILDSGHEIETISFEVNELEDHTGLLEDLQAIEGVKRVRENPALKQIFGKRIIIIGGGAQVGQVAVGAVAEADRHNLRGERISVDTIALVGEKNIAEAVRASSRLPRVRVVVLAGSLMGGDIEIAVKEVRERGLEVISLNMAGSVPDVADLVVTDAVQAGVMAVMAASSTTAFSISRLKKRVF